MLVCFSRAPKMKTIGAVSGSDHGDVQAGSGMHGPRCAWGGHPERAARRPARLCAFRGMQPSSSTLQRCNIELRLPGCVRLCLGPETRYASGYQRVIVPSHPHIITSTDASYHHTIASSHEHLREKPGLAMTARVCVHDVGVLIDDALAPRRTDCARRQQRTRHQHPGQATPAANPQSDAALHCETTSTQLPRLGRLVHIWVMFGECRGCASRIEQH